MKKHEVKRENFLVPSEFMLAAHADIKSSKRLTARLHITKDKEGLVYVVQARYHQSEAYEEYISTISFDEAIKEYNRL